MKTKDVEKTLQTEASQREDFRLHLQRELIERCQKNPKYSMRAFAKSLGISSAALSDILNKKRPLTLKMLQRLGLGLGLSADELTRFDVALTPPKAQDSQSDKFKRISLDAFAVISEWYHYGILELMLVKGFKNNARWVSRALGISVHEATAAIERLARLGLIKIEESGKWVDTSGGFTTNIDDNLTSQGSKKLQRQILEMGLRALDEVPIEERNHTSITLAMNPKKLPQAIQKIKTFRRELSEFLTAGDLPTHVYQMSFALFPATKLISEDNE